MFKLHNFSWLECVIDMMLYGTWMHMIDTHQSAVEIDVFWFIEHLVKSEKFIGNWKNVDKKYM